MTTVSKTFVAAAAVSLLVNASPSFAQRRSGERSGSSGGSATPRAAAPRSIAPRAIAPRVGVETGRYNRPYYGYSFRPRVSVGLGLWAGFGYPYYYGSYGYASPYYPPYRFGYPYGSTYRYYAPYAYGYAYPPADYSAYPPSVVYPPSSGTVDVQQGQRSFGGVSFEITPATAEVFIDGAYVGTAGDFAPSRRPLDLTPGRHRIEIRAQDFRTMVFDADVEAGEVVPYRGALQQP